MNLTNCKHIVALVGRSNLLQLLFMDHITNDFGIEIFLHDLGRDLHVGDNRIVPV